MGNILVLAEKPSVGRELARVLGCRQARDGYFEGGGYTVTWALGHLVTLADPENYGERYRKWSLEDLPMLPEKMELVVIRETQKQFGVVRRLLNSPATDELVIATDAGREGELVARWILEKTGFHKKIRRLWISSQTDKAIREGFAQLRPARDFDNLYRSAVCRAEADWLVGLNVTRALTCKFNAQLSAGRVQTPTLAMIVAREEEIRSFRPQEYFTLRAEADGFRLGWRDRRSGSRRISDPEAAQRLEASLSGRDAVVTSVRREQKREAPPLLYDLTELQRDANRRYGFSARQTLNCMQRLYEEHKLLTYPRTDSRYLTADIIPTLADRVKSVSVGPYTEAARSVLRGGIHPSRRFVDDARVTDHHAIIPTEQFVELDRLSGDDRKVYDLVVRRFLAALSPDCEFEQVTVTAEIGGEEFTASGRLMRSAGWKTVGETQEAAEDNDETDEQELPDIRQGATLKIPTIRRITGKTQPLARYNEATLLTAMEHPGKMIGDGVLRDVVNSTGGIGTPATRADIIEKLFSSSYVERRGREIVPLSKGVQLIGLAPEELRSPELTARWEQRLTAISRGEARSADFLREMREFASRLVGSVTQSDASYRHDNLTRTPCPLCGKFLLEVNGKRGKMLVCSDRECGYRQNLSYLSNARCPNCHKKLEVFGEGEKKLYLCHTCGFREKFDSFNRRLSDKHGVSRQEVRKYLSAQEEKSPPAASAFAQAWAEAQKKK